MQSTAALCVIVLCFFVYTSAFIAPVRYINGGSRFHRLAASDDDYNSLIANVKKNTPPGSVIVIKYGGHAMENEELKRFFCEDIAALCNVSTHRYAQLSGCF